jgi:hypothetical protein
MQRWRHGVLVACSKTHTYIHTSSLWVKRDLLDASGQNRVIVTIMTASPRAFQRCIGLGGVDKVLVRLEDYYSAETAVWQPALPSRGPLLGRYAL